MTDLVKRDSSDLLEEIVVGGDLARLSPEQRLTYYQRVCESMGLNPLTQPFQYIRLNGRLTLYATRAAADQLRKLHGVSITNMDVDSGGDMAVVTCTGSDQGGRSDTDVGVVPLKGLSGDARANAVLKAVTKAKRRLTLSLCGLGWLDETEVETIPDAQPVTITSAGEIAEGPTRSELEPTYTAQPEKPKAKYARPMDAETIRAALREKAAKLEDGKELKPEFRHFVAGRMNDLFGNDDITAKSQKRHSVLLYVFGVDTSEKLTTGQCRALRAWSTDEVKEGDETTLLPNPDAISEAQAMVNAYDEERGRDNVDQSSEPEPITSLEQVDQIAF